MPSLAGSSHSKKEIPSGEELLDFLDVLDISRPHFRLKKKLDENWYEGELGGKIGMFPVDYVDVVVPLP